MSDEDQVADDQDFDDEDDDGNRDLGAIPRDVLEYVAKSIVDDPDAVVVEVDDRGNRIDLRLHVAPDDMGKVIGRRGRNVQAIRAVVRAAAARDGVEADVDVVEQATLEIGQIARPHGLRGEVVVHLVTNRAERLAPGAVLVGGSGSTLEVRAARQQASTWIVAFDGVTSREAAEALRGTVLRAEPLDDPDALWVHELIGKPVVDAGGDALGRVEAIQANPASDLIVLDGGGLIPLRFVTATDADQVTVDIPPGLLDLE